MNQMSRPQRDAEQDDPGNTLRQPPHNLEAERALIGAILMSNRAYERVSDFLRSDHFFDRVNARIYDVCCQLLEKGQAANPVTLKPYLDNDEAMRSAGGMKYLGTIAASAVTIINSADYGRLIYDLYLRRELIDLGTDSVNEAYDAKPSETAQEMIESIQERLYQLDHHAVSDYQMVSLDTALDRALELAERAHKNEGAVVGVTTGLRDLDRKLSGLHPSDLILIAGATSSGKTSLATTIAYNAAYYFQNTERPEHAGKRVAVFSLEMSDDQLATRILARHAKVNSFLLRAGGLSTEDFHKLIDAKHSMQGMPFDIDPTPGITINAIRSRCRKIARKATKTGETGLGLIVVDYLQLIQPPRGERRENRVQEISAITRGLKMLAKEFSCPVVALSALSRAVDGREDKRPMLSDLRDGGTQEFDADVVLFVYREQYYLERNEPQQRPEESIEKFHARKGLWDMRLEKCAGTAEAIIAKQRHGPIGSVTLVFDASGTWFENHNDDDGQGFEQRTLL